MTDMTAFERRLSSEISGLMGPVRPVDDLAVFESVTAASRQKGWEFTMLSALKFIAAGVIVALFGGFLLAGVLTAPQGDEMAPAAVTESPSTMTNDEILPGVDLAVEEVEPGAYRVVGDGVRDLASKNDTDIVAGHDGGIWLLRPQRFFRLGGDEWLAWATERPYVRDFEVAPDGTVWTVQEPPGEDNTDPAAIQSFDGEDWTEHQKSWGEVLEVTPDGTVWAFWQDPEQESGQLLGYLDEDGWQALGVLPAGQLLVAGPGDIWAVAGPMSEFLKLYRFVDGGWQRWVTLEGTEPTWQRAEEPPEGAALVLPVAVGPDGTFWGVAHSPDVPDSLVRLDSSGWSRWPVEGTGFSAAAGMEVATDGSVWYASGSPADTCGGVARFDEGTPHRYLSGLCVAAIDITADGAVWLLATEAGADLRDVYVITPEAVAASE